jgi:penicillin G amidase
MRKRLLRYGFYSVATVLLVLACLVAWFYYKLRLSLPQLDGEVVVSGISQEVTIERDSLGIPTIRAQTRKDLAYATGYVHAQDRFFQMDLLRRNSAGELAELVGSAVLDRDQSTRVHRFRSLAEQRLAREDAELLSWLESYTAGVNDGLNSLSERPFEYLMLGATPAAWKPEDCYLVTLSMFLDLQGGQFGDEYRRGMFRDAVPPPVFEFLMNRGGESDAPLIGQPLPVPPIPSADVFDPRVIPDNSKQRSMPQPNWEAAHEPEVDTPYATGSNNWAVAGSHTVDGRALLANDMHLRFQVPHIWYRASLVTPERRTTGITLPGTPAMIVGSNGSIAWGFTNTEADWVDVVVLEPHGNDPRTYKTPDGPKVLETIDETILVKDSEPVIVKIQQSIWGPVVAKDRRGRYCVSRWVAGDVDGFNLQLLRMESCQDVDQAVATSHRCGTPHQNVVIADSRGRIAWTVMGRIPRRVGHDGYTPQSWADGSSQWNGYLAGEEYPRLIDPPQGRVWTANARVVSGDDYRKLGDGDYDRGARQKQIRDALLAIDKADEKSMLQLQLDDRALFLERWRVLMTEVLESSESKSEVYRDLLGAIKRWDGRASADSVGYRVVRAFRNRVIHQACRFWSRVMADQDPEFTLAANRKIEDPVWRILQEKTEHYLDPAYPSWQNFLESQVESVVESIGRQGGVSGFTWGKINKPKVQHPLSLAVPVLSWWLDMPHREQSGGWSDMPKIVSPRAGASQRMVVSPGHEEDGIMHMPCGQSGHPLSPHYCDSHSAWELGEPTPFLPSQAIHTLRLVPQ